MVQAHRIKTVAIVGCTAVGKSDVALWLAQKYGGELIGADSMQIYRGFDIGTGKLTKEECNGIPHHMIDIVDGDADFSVGEYVTLARAAIRDVASRGKLPIVVGGTGMYVYSLLSGCDFAETAKDKSVRTNLKIATHFFGPTVLHSLLARVDKPSADNISKNDAKRIERALEIYALTGRPKSIAAGHIEPPYDALTIVLTLPRDILYNKINERVKMMFDRGLIEEALTLSRYKKCGSMQALGYKQIVNAESTDRAVLEPMVAQKTRNYAKRQITYFKNMKLDKLFIDVRDADAIDKAVGDFLGVRQ